VLELDPANLDGLMNLASLAEHQSDYEQLESRLREVTSHHPDHPLALKKLAVAQSRRCPDQSALALMERAFQVNPRDTECLLLLGYLYEKNVGPERAIELYERMKADNPKLARLAGEKIRRLTQTVKTVEGMNGEHLRREDLGEARGAQEPLHQRLSNNEFSRGYEIIIKPKEEGNA
jgi:tetratricopeptide (TPR) repeat protein